MPLMKQVLLEYWSGLMPAVILFQPGPGPRIAASTAIWARSCGPCSPQSTT